MSIMHILTPEEKNLIGTQCPQLFMDCFNFDVTYDYSDDIRVWRGGNESKKILTEEIEESDYSEEVKGWLRSAIVTVEGNRNLPTLLPELGTVVKVNRAKGWLGLARTGLTMRQVTRAIWLRKYLAELEQMTSNTDRCFVWSPAFNDNPGLYKNKMAISDTVQARINSIVHLFGREDYKNLRVVETHLVFQSDELAYDGFSTFMSKSSFLIDYRDYDYGTKRVTIDDTNYIFDEDLVTVNRISFAVFDKPTKEVEPMFTIERDGDAFFTIVPNA